MRTPPVQLVLSVPEAAVLGLSCATASSHLYGPPPKVSHPPSLSPLGALPGAELTGFGGTLAAPPQAPSPSFAQSCGPACATPVAPSTGEILAPAAARATQVLERTVQVVQALQGFLTVTKFLDESQKKHAEKLIVECVKEAHFKVEEDLFGKGKSLPAADC